MISIRDEDHKRIKRIKELTFKSGELTGNERAEVYRLSSQVLVNIDSLMQEQPHVRPMIAARP